jgi:hypothetical protein
VLLVPAEAFAVPNHKTPFAFALMIDIPFLLITQRVPALWARQELSK